MIDWPNVGSHISRIVWGTRAMIVEAKSWICRGWLQPCPSLSPSFSTLSTLLSSLPLKKRETKKKTSLQGRREGTIPAWSSCKGANKKEALREKLCKETFRVGYLVKSWASIRTKAGPLSKLHRLTDSFWHSGVQRRENWGRDRRWGWKIKTKSFFLSERNELWNHFFSFFCTL